MVPLFNVAPLDDDVRALLSATFSVHDVAEMDDPESWLKRHGARIEYVLTDGHRGLPSAFFDALPDLKLISSNGVGYDAIDTDAALARGVMVTHTPSVLDAEVATTALMLLIACYRQLLANADQARTGRWETQGNLPLSRTVDGRTVGILGLGRIGKAFATKLAPFDARILYSGRHDQRNDHSFYADPVEMARDADAIVSILPGGAGTRHLVNAEVLEALGPEGVFINVGRGSVVDEPALIDALEAGKLGAAGLDVFAAEPHIPEALRALPNVVLTPHIGSATVETRAAMARLAVDNLVQHQKDGTVLTPVPECVSLT